MCFQAAQGLRNEPAKFMPEQGPPLKEPSSTRVRLLAGQKLQHEVNSL